MKVELLYGHDGITVDVQDDIGVTVIRKHPMTPLTDPLQAVGQALENPVKSSPLSELARGKKNVCILICDITRPVPNGILLPPLIEKLTAAGISKENILILVATGLHRPNKGDELREIIGSDELFNSIRLENHFARDREAHVDLGKTSGDIPIMIDRRFVEADLKIVTGLVEPHFFAGYSGGRKVVAPGIAYQDTILMFHTARILEHGKAANCIIQGNPLHKEQMEIVHNIGGILSLNVAIDEERRIGFVNFGQIEASHLEAVDFMRNYAEVSIPRRFKTIVTTSAGYPLDRTYYQTVKGMVGVLDVLEPGGTIIIASECSEGMGSREFVAAQRLLCEVGLDRFMSTLEGRDKALIDEWQTEMLVKALRGGNVQLYTTGLGKADLNDLFVETVSSVEAAIIASVKAHGDHEIAVVPEGPYTIPLYGGG
ncbi:MAG: nickel-dependent lactate racemase [Deltaproteobacteria bacterium]|nr:nickel-dependent lactate racemase [Deltaproteobacteria bacterium]